MIYDGCHYTSFFAKNKLINQLKFPDILQLNSCHYNDRKRGNFLSSIYIRVIFIRKKFTLKLHFKEDPCSGKINKMYFKSEQVSKVVFTSLVNVEIRKILQLVQMRFLFFVGPSSALL